MTGNRAPIDSSARFVGEVSETGKYQDGLNRSAGVWIAASVVIGAVLAIILHAVVGSFVVVADELSYGVLGRTLGAEVVASIWALLAFSGSAYVFYRYHTTIRGAGLWKGFRYGSAIALLWLVGMLEGVALFGNPILAEFLIGLSDAVPVLIMSILLGIFVFRADSTATNHSTHIRSVPVLVTIVLIYVAGRYLGYISGIISTGHSEYPAQTFVWTLLMGLSVGIAFLLLGKATFTTSTIRSAARFGFWIFGVNWILFMAFIPLLFEGTIVDVTARVSLDIVVVILGCYAAVRLWNDSGE